MIECKQLLGQTILCANVMGCYLQYVLVFLFRKLLWT